MDTKNRLTDFKGEEGQGDWKRLAKDHVCIYAQSMTQATNNVVKAEEEGLGRGGEENGAGCRGTKGKKLGDICNSDNNKRKTYSRLSSQPSD